MKLTMCQGLPASGKSTWAAEQAAVTVNKDVIRLLLKAQGWVWSPENEADVIKKRDAQIEHHLANGRDVISSDTNFGRKHKVALEGLAKKYGATFEIKRFDVPLEECLQRNALREGDTKVPNTAIEDMYYRYVVNDRFNYPLSAPKEAPTIKVIAEEHLMKAIICDLDGTLAINNGHRGVYDHSKCDQDKCNMEVRRCLEVYSRQLFYQIIYLTGREEKFRVPTNMFLTKFDCPTGPLYMRPTNDTRKDSIVKRELFDKHVKDKYNVEFVLDDRNQVVAMWRSLGLQCWQVAEGDF